MTSPDLKEFENLTRPVIKWLNDNHHPHAAVIITPVRADLLEGLLGFPTDEYLKD